MEITVNVVREKIRKKMLYITIAMGTIVVALFSSDMGSITIGGKEITDYYVMVPILINVLNFLAGAIALAISVTTVPNEYERQTSHLIWARGIGQPRYHMELAMGNVLISWISGMLLYLTLGVFSVIHGYNGILGKIAEATVFMMIYTTIICMLSTAMSVRIPVMFTTVIMIFVLVGGAFRSVLTLMASVLTGVGGMVVKRLITVIPNLAGLSAQAGNLVQGKPVNIHEIITGLFIIWLAGLGILLFRREEA